MSENKKELRERMKSCRKHISKRKQKDKLISDAFFEYIAKYDFESFFVYVSIGSETDTVGIIEKLLNAGKKVCVPYTNAGNMSVKVLPKLPNNLIADKSGNIEGVAEYKNADFECDCALVPMLAFNGELFRLGYGVGYYDKFLSPYNGVKIGLAYAEQFNDDIPVESHDIRLDVIITQNKKYFTWKENGKCE